jgi:stigma-specific protein Stig1
MHSSRSCTPVSPSRGVGVQIARRGAALSVLVALIAWGCSRDERPSGDGVDDSAAIASTTVMRTPESDIAADGALGFGESERLFRNVDDGVAFAAADDDATYVASAPGVSAAFHTVGYGSAPSGVVRKVTISYRARRLGFAKGTAQAKLYDGDTLVATGRAHALSGWSNYHDTFKVSVANAQGLRTQLSFANVAGRDSLAYTQIWLTLVVLPGGGNDGGAPGDSEMGLDAVALDAGSERDGGSSSDADVVQDAVPVLDSAVAQDAAPALDASAAPDAAFAVDAAVELDGAPSFDAAIARGDASLDSGGGQDGGPSTDAADPCPQICVCWTGGCSCTDIGTPCGPICADIQNDRSNCGGCGQVCAGGEICSAGACACPATLTSCGGSCVSMSLDNQNCGACGHACVGGESCLSGACVAGGPNCPGAPPGATGDQIAAINMENSVRMAMGSPCAAMPAAANLSASRHALYNCLNFSVATCLPTLHEEVAGCSGFSGVWPPNRMLAAGYAGAAAAEDVAFVGNGAEAIAMWIDMPFHRVPVLSPWVRDVGYGNTTAGAYGFGCDAADFGIGAPSSPNIVVTYPYPGQVDVPNSYDGNGEIGLAPAPPAGWPSGYPISIFIQGSIATHVLTVAGSSSPLEHVFTTWGPASIMYADTPLLPRTTYRVQAEGSNAAGPVRLDWTFTTR